MDQSRRQARLERNRAQARRGQLKWLVYISIAAVVVVGLLILSNQVTAPEPRSYANKNGMTLGDPAAPVQLFEVADFQCPVCRTWWNEVEPLIVEKYVDSGQVSLTVNIVAFLDAAPNGESTRAAVAGYCAADQNMYWEFHDVVYTNWAGENQGAFRDDRLRAFASSINLDMSAFNSCFDSGEKIANVEAAQEYALGLGIDAVPSFVVNGQVYRGLKSFTELSVILDEAIASAGAN
jgi:protein-disulfide isomerase